MYSLIIAYKIKIDACNDEPGRDPRSPSTSNDFVVVPGSLRAKLVFAREELTLRTFRTSDRPAATASPPSRTRCRGGRQTRDVRDLAVGLAYACRLPGAGRGEMPCSMHASNIQCTYRLTDFRATSVQVVSCITHRVHAPRGLSTPATAVCARFRAIRLQSLDKNLDNVRMHELELFLCQSWGSSIGKVARVAIWLCLY